MKFDGKVALVTGGASGIGKATVMEFARRGATVICADVDEKKGAEVVSEVRQGNVSIEYLPIDLAESASIRRSAAFILTATSPHRHSGQCGGLE